MAKLKKEDLINLNLPRQIVIVKWRDSNVYYEQNDYSNDNFLVAEIETVGYCIGNEEDRLVIARDFINEEWRGVIVIPKENIVYKRELL